MNDALAVALGALLLIGIVVLAVWDDVRERTDDRTGQREEERIDIN
ncbi:hypothetical protein [Nocardia iowensis]|uniref:Uncharacterized protein n=1 Tax=Nocardia iowensis TaxID=204891 RepID=A0ABX8RMY9_NOCIO|nr:hypothetical protein [Nocardia iowensis]QXN91004.1 hypothetical protein KV110_37555 [Nocardia iowensis]